MACLKYGTGFLGKGTFKKVCMEGREKDALVVGIQFSPSPLGVFFYGIPTWLLLLASCICIFIHDTPGVLALASVFIGWLVGRLALSTYLLNNDLYQSSLS